MYMKTGNTLLGLECLAAELYCKANRQSNRFCSKLGFLFSIARQNTWKESIIDESALVQNHEMFF